MTSLLPQRSILPMPSQPPLVVLLPQTAAAVPSRFSHRMPPLQFSNNNNIITTSTQQPISNQQLILNRVIRSKSSPIPSNIFTNQAYSQQQYPQQQHLTRHLSVIRNKYNNGSVQPIHPPQVPNSLLAPFPRVNNHLQQTHSYPMQQPVFLQQQQQPPQPILISGSNQPPPSHILVPNQSSSFLSNSIRNPLQFSLNLNRQITRSLSTTSTISANNTLQMPLQSQQQQQPPMLLSLPYLQPQRQYITRSSSANLPPIFVTRSVFPQQLHLQSYQPQSQRQLIQQLQQPQTIVQPLPQSQPQPSQPILIQQLQSGVGKVTTTNPQLQLQCLQSQQHTRSPPPRSAVQQILQNQQSSLISSHGSNQKITIKQVDSSMRQEINTRTVRSRSVVSTAGCAIPVQYQHINNGARGQEHLQDPSRTVPMIIKTIPVSQQHQLQRQSQRQLQMTTPSKEPQVCMSPQSIRKQQYQRFSQPPLNIQSIQYPLDSQVQQSVQKEGIVSKEQAQCHLQQQSVEKASIYKSQQPLILMSSIKSPEIRSFTANPLLLDSQQRGQQNYNIHNHPQQQQQQNEITVLSSKARKSLDLLRSSFTPPSVKAFQDFKEPTERFHDLIQDSTQQQPNGQLNPQRYVDNQLKQLETYTNEPTSEHNPAGLGLVGGTLPATWTEASSFVQQATSAFKTNNNMDIAYSHREHKQTNESIQEAHEISQQVYSPVSRLRDQQQQQSQSEKENVDWLLSKSQQYQEYQQGQQQFQQADAQDEQYSKSILYETAKPADYSKTLIYFHQQQQPPQEFQLPVSYSPLSAPKKSALPPTINNSLRYKESTIETVLQDKRNTNNPGDQNQPAQITGNSNSNPQASSSSSSQQASQYEGINGEFKVKRFTLKIDNIRKVVENLEEKALRECNVTLGSNNNNNNNTTANTSSTLRGSSNIPSTTTSEAVRRIENMQAKLGFSGQDHRERLQEDEEIVEVEPYSDSQFKIGKTSTEEGAGIVVATSSKPTDSEKKGKIKILHGRLEHIRLSSRNQNGKKTMEYADISKNTNDNRMRQGYFNGSSHSEAPFTAPSDLVLYKFDENLNALIPVMIDQDDNLQQNAQVNSQYPGNNTTNNNSTFRYIQYDQSQSTDDPHKNNKLFTSDYQPSSSSSILKDSVEKRYNHSITKTEPKRKNSYQNNSGIYNINNNNNSISGTSSLTFKTPSLGGSDINYQFNNISNSYTNNKSASKIMMNSSIHQQSAEKSKRDRSSAGRSTTQSYSQLHSAKKVWHY